MKGSASSLIISSHELENLDEDLQNHDDAGGTYDPDNKPRSPLFQKAGIINCASPSSPGTSVVSEFEFGSAMAMAEGTYEPPVSPKLVARSWTTMTGGPSNKQSMSNKSKDEVAIARSGRGVGALDHHVEHRKTKSGVLTDHPRRVGELPPLVIQRNEIRLASKSESRSHLKGSVPSSSSPSSYGTWGIRNCEDQPAINKGRSQKQGKKWAFKDFLRRTVASSKPDQVSSARNYGGADTASSYNNMKLRSSTSAPMSPASSPPRSPLYQYYDARSTLPSPTMTPTGRPSNRIMTPTTPNGRSSNLSTSYGTASPRSPMSPHALQYYHQLHKAQSQELTKKTFLPYRQSLLGCLGSFPSEQQVW